MSEDNAKYVNIKVKIETRDSLKRIADMLNELDNSKNKVTVAGLVTMFAEKYRNGFLAMEASKRLEEWINSGMPIMVNVLTKNNKGITNESK